MNPTFSRNPRSILHGLKPLGQGSAETESLLSYFCRLATSHCTSTLELSRKLLNLLGMEPAAKYAWYDRQVSGLGEGAQTYTAALAATTSVADLHLLTFLPWKHVIASNGLPLHKSGQFCPQCLHEDHSSGQTLYLRLCWEPTQVTVCHKHKVALQSHCPHCKQNNARHTSAFTVVGWCGKCGMFMGQELVPGTIDGLELWKAQQIAKLVECQHTTLPEPTRMNVVTVIEHIIEKSCNGQYAAFAKNLGIAKSTVHAWLRDGRTPSIDMSLRIARFAGIDLTALLMGKTEGLELHIASTQLPLPLEYPARPQWNRRVHAHDWESIEQQLQAILRQPMPVSVMHAASVVRIPPRMLYMKCNTTTRKIAHRWLLFLKRRQQSHIVAAWPYLEKACRGLMDAGIAPNMREVEQLVPAQILNRVCNFWDVLRQVRDYIESSEHAQATFARASTHKNSSSTRD